MSVSITVQGTTIPFPSSGESPNWAPAIIEFAQAVEAALATVAGNYDIPAQVYSMISNVNTNVSLPNLSFPTSQVRGAIISYAVYRNTSITTASETGSILINYNASFASNQKWQVSRDCVSDASITFTVTDVGQVQFSSSSLAGSGHTGTITYQAKAILQGS